MTTVPNCGLWNEEKNCARRRFRSFRPADNAPSTFQLSSARNKKEQHELNAPLCLSFILRHLPACHEIKRRMRPHGCRRRHTPPPPPQKIRRICYNSIRSDSIKRSNFERKFKLLTRTSLRDETIRQLLVMK